MNYYCPECGKMQRREYTDDPVIKSFCMDHGIDTVMFSTGMMEKLDNAVSNYNDNEDPQSPLDFSDLHDMLEDKY